MRSDRANSGPAKVNQIRTEIISMLQSGNFVSGEHMSAQLGITRSAVSNHIKALSKLGLDIFSVKGRGYKLAQPLILLDEFRIREGLDRSNDVNIKVCNIVSSTNDQIKAQASVLPQGSVCLAEAQTQGRGRRGRKWVSPFGASVYMSMLWRFDSGYQSMAGLSLLIGIGVNRALHKIGINDCRLKWPNDVYHEGKKLAGILIEVEGQIGGSTTAIIGLGINIQLPSNIEQIDQAFTDVSTITQGNIDRNEFVCKLLEELWGMLPQFEAEGLAPFLQQWRDADLFYNRPISLISGDYVTLGVSKGIDNSGALLLEVDGRVKAYHGGEISVRPAKVID